MVFESSTNTLCVHSLLTILFMTSPIGKKQAQKNPLLRKLLSAYCYSMLPFEWRSSAISFCHGLSNIGHKSGQGVIRRTLECELVLQQSERRFPNQRGIGDYITVLFDQHTKGYLGKELERVLVSKSIFTEPFHFVSESSKNLDLILEDNTSLEQASVSLKLRLA